MISMSQKNKLSLWQKLKKLLTSRAPQSVIDAVDRQEDIPSTRPPTEHASSHTNSTEHTSGQTNQRAKVSLKKRSSDTASHTPIVDYLKDYFYKKQWHYTYYRPKSYDPQQSHHLSLRMKHKKLDCGYLFRVQEKNALLAVYGILPFLIPESHQSAAMLLITQINYDMLIGNLEMDLNDGEIRFKNAIDIEAVALNDDIIEHLLQSVIAMTTVAHEVFNDLLNTKKPSEDVPTLLNELREQSDARTFYLPTQKKQ